MKTKVSKSLRPVYGKQYSFDDLLEMRGQVSDKSDLFQILLLALYCDKKEGDRKRTSMKFSLMLKGGGWDSVLPVTDRRKISIDIMPIPHKNYSYEYALDVYSVIGDPPRFAWQSLIGQIEVAEWYSKYKNIPMSEITFLGTTNSDWNRVWAWHKNELIENQYREWKKKNRRKVDAFDAKGEEVPFWEEDSLHVLVNGELFEHTEIETPLSYEDVINVIYDATTPSPIIETYERAIKLLREDFAQCGLSKNVEKINWRKTKYPGIIQPLLPLDLHEKRFQYKKSVIEVSQPKAAQKKGGVK